MAIVHYPAGHLASVTKTQHCLILTSQFNQLQTAFACSREPCTYMCEWVPPFICTPMCAVNVLEFKSDSKYVL